MPDSGSLGVTKNFTREKLRKRLREIDERIARYLSELDRADDVHAATGMLVSEAEVQRIIDRIAWLKKESDKLTASRHPRVVICF